MNPVEMCFSSRIYTILSSNTVQDKNFESNESENTESDEEIPLECCYCSELFFDKQKFDLHDCGKKLPDSVRKIHLCLFDGCKKSFKKTSDLQKHQVRS